MTDTTCPSCDAPAPARARSCARCGYRFLEDAGPARRPPRPGPRQLALGIGAALAVAAVALAVAALGGGGGDEDTARGAASGGHLEVLSTHPLSTRAAERAIEDRFITLRDDDTAAARCSGRIPKPAHSVRRCRLRYPAGNERIIILLTTANGAEVISKH